MSRSVQYSNSRTEAGVNNLARLHEYHFSFGNSTTGAIGFCTAVTAESAEEAVEILRKELPESFSVPLSNGGSKDDRVVYAQVYINGEGITKRNIDMIDEEDVMPDTEVPQS